MSTTAGELAPIVIHVGADGRNVCGAAGVWTSRQCAEETTPAAFAFPFNWEGVAICADCARQEGERAA